MKITRDEAYDLLKSKLTNKNLIRHGLAAEAVMRALAERFDQDAEVWGVVGLLHDGDYEETGDDLTRHARVMVEWLRDLGEDDEDLLNAILSHVYAHTGENEPSTPMEWSINCCDELTGLIVAVTLVMPSKKLADVTPEAVLKKFPKAAFARSVDREQITRCEEKLHIPLPEFVEISLTAMQGIAEDLGL